MSSGKWRPFCLGLDLFIHHNVWFRFITNASFPSTGSCKDQMIAPVLGSMMCNITAGECIMWTPADSMNFDTIKIQTDFWT